MPWSRPSSNSGTGIPVTSWPRRRARSSPATKAVRRGPGSTPAWGGPGRPDPWIARSAGLVGPILHGLCTYGFAGRALLHEVCGGDPDRFGSMSARFASMVVPGDTLDVSVWRTADGALFRAGVGDRVVLDRGTFRLRTR